ncbi:MAG: PadR family transcriptional regulator [Acidobacteriota bacterium]
MAGADFGSATRLQSGTLYPILLRLEQAGWVESYWESATPQELGRPRRRFYQLTAVGARTAKEGFRDFASRSESWHGAGANTRFGRYPHSRIESIVWRRSARFDRLVHAAVARSCDQAPARKSKRTVR